MKRLLVICILLLGLPACASFQEAWKENSATAPDGSTLNSDMKLSIGSQEKTESEEKTDLYGYRGDGPVKDVQVGVSNEWKF